MIGSVVRTMSPQIVLRVYWYCSPTKDYCDSAVVQLPMNSVRASIAEIVSDFQVMRGIYYTVLLVDNG